MAIGGLVSTSSAATGPAPSTAKAEFGAVSLLVFVVIHTDPEPLVVEAHPTGRVGAMTPSKLSDAPHVAGPTHWSFVVHASPSSHGPEFGLV
jgi:hypothetical protein